MIITENDISLLDNSAVALGAFDGIHIAHQKLIEQTTEYAKKHNVKSMVFTFDHIPSGAKRITTQSDRKEIFEALGVDGLFIQKFDNDFKNITAFQFLNKYLKSARFVCVGFNFRFGKDRQGGVKEIKDFCDSNGIDHLIVDEVVVDGHTVSSSLVREYITKCDFFSAAKLLGRSVFVSGIVEVGDKIGRNLGFPTANIEQNNLIVPKGVYATVTTVDGVKYKSVTNIGGKPTIRDNVDRIETHIIGYDDNAYGKYIKTEFIAKIRDTKRFHTTEQLKKQLACDVNTAKQLI